MSARKAEWTEYGLIVSVAHLKYFLAGVHVPVGNHDISQALITLKEKRTNHFTPSIVLAKITRSSTLMKFTKAYPTLHPGGYEINRN